MRPNKWKSFIHAQENREYLALLSYLPLKRYSAIPKFLKYVSKIDQQLQTANGLIGYSLQAQPLLRKFWTLSVWEDSDALMAFVRSIPHGDVMKLLASDMDQTNFAQWKIQGSAIPPDWIGAKERMFPGSSRA